MMEEVDTKRELRCLADWFESGEAYMLIGAYRDHWQQGTTGTADWSRGRPAVINEHGVLHPERFKEYMLMLKQYVLDRLEDREDDRSDSTLRGFALLQTTLGQMLGSTEFGDDTQPGTSFKLKELFDNGKEEGMRLGRYLRAIGCQIDFGMGGRQ